MPKRPSPALRDVARACGLSISAVSDALRNRPNIPPETRERVRAAAERIGYRPDARLSQLMSYLRERRGSARAPNLAWLNLSPGEKHWRTQPYKRGFLHGARLRAEALGYVLDEIWGGSPRMSFARLARIVKTRNVQGLVIPAVDWPGDNENKIDWSELAAVYLDTTSLGPELSVVNVDYAENMRLALEALRLRGHRRIGYWIGDFIDHVSGRLYSAVYLEHHARAGGNRPPMRDLESVAGLEPAAWARRHRLDAVICNEADTVERLQQAGLRVPQDVSVVHLNLREDVAGWAGVDQKHELIGSASVDVVVAQLHRGERGPPENPRRVLIKGAWVDGQTCLARG